MPEYTPPKKNVPAGLPLWVMTFADLMTLLMCFFVLILSFSELDILKYKQLAGSMAHAFGVQRDIEAKDPPKGINIIAREFSPGQPQPTPMNVVRQKTTSDLRIHLEVGGHKTRPTPAPRNRDNDPSEEATMKPEKPAERMADEEIEQKAGQHAEEQAGEQSRELPGQQLTQEEIRQQEEALEKKMLNIQAEREEIEQVKEEIRKREEALRALEAAQGERLDDATAEEILAAREARERQRQLEEDASRIMTELDEQIQDGAVDVEREGQKIIIRIREKASFASGSAEVVGKFRPVLWRLGEIIEGMEGRVIVAGHTDSIPINTARFRSNWELSSGRAVSVVHELLWQTAIPLERFLVQGHGESLPMAPNDTAANRARNRRVEIILMRGDDREAEQEISRQGVRPRSGAPDARRPQPESPLTNMAQGSPEAGPAPVAEPVPAAAIVPLDPEAKADPEPRASPREVLEAVAAPADVSSTAAPATVSVPPAGGDGPVMAVPAAPERVRGSGVTAGAVRPPAATAEKQETP